ncbi:MAG: DNA starvation/stationary phase protection protein [Bifidobacteriaceae bacterium]|jgi:starvation-inducible DNA-binding protein|nr:DNA starvation/stationary phase protection protein [Bifidobacteriaceae bacterium]
MSKYKFTVPTLDDAKTEKAIEVLQFNLDILNDLALTLKHAHWNVTGDSFIAVHEMLDPEIDDIRDGVDQIAERIATLGGSPNGLSSSVLETAKSSIPEYGLKKRDKTDNHLKKVNEQYTAVETILRSSIAKLDDLDLISSNLLQDILGKMELFQWKVRSHLI